MEGSAQGRAAWENKRIFSSPAHEMQSKGGKEERRPPQITWPSVPQGKLSPLPRIRWQKSHTSGGSQTLFQQRSARHTMSALFNKALQFIAPEFTKVGQRHSGKSGRGQWTTRTKVPVERCFHSHTPFCFWGVNAEQLSI